jgi:geranylgeranylglycerol-phosphate geranylgeranyltransferase
MAFILGLTIAYACEGRLAGQWAGMWFASIGLSLVIAAGYVFNDVCDRDIDRLNAPQRPVACGLVPAGLAAIWAIVLALAGIGVAAAACRPAFVVMLAVVAGGLAVYDLLAKHLGVGKQLFVATLMTSIYPLAIAQAGLPEDLTLAKGRLATLLFFPAWLFLTSFSYEVLKDIRDMVGDRAATGHTNWIINRPRLARRVASTCTAIGAAVLLLPALVGCGTVYAAIVPAAILAGVVSILLPIRTAMAAIYVECVIVGIAAMADLYGS